MPKLIDETGNRYGRLLVLSRAPNKGTAVCWHCLCDCGNEKDIRANDLRSGKTLSCGCLRSESVSEAHALKIPIGTKRNRLTIIKRIESDKFKNIRYECKCECGNHTIVTASNFINDKVKSCGCLDKEKFIQRTKLRSEQKINQNNMQEDELPIGMCKDLRGQKFGRLTVLYRVISPNPQHPYAFWKCQCDCGNTIIVSNASLVSGNTKSCGCFARDRASEINTIPLLPGEKFGMLTVIQRQPRDGSGRVKYLCKCDCGNYTTTYRTVLLNGRKKSCGCAKSTGEQKIKRFLQQNNINFTIEQSFENLLGDKKTKLRFDFYINNSYLIEYDGIQHFKPVEYFGGEKQFQLQKHYDKIKNEYCKTHNIPLIRIPYWHYNDITIEDLKPETSQFLIT